MPLSHKNKTLATFTATVFGSIGLHRFYLKGPSDIWGWLHFATLPTSLLAYWLWGKDQQVAFLFAPLIISGLVACLESLIIGLTPDEKWDAKYNAHSGRQSDSSWFVILLVVLTLGVGAIALIGAIARTFDLLFTGGAYG
ncbi:putative transmembrane protein [Collimonas arenae]|uniref:Putative transmembrane protein n=1 Tax=Collimonas arenae TaxID=279058 RepID=A0A0A1FIW6_9BURK|nr:NINE protein [Collimonas arenae]AIY42797.1 putative transmembrane protein [Collimonas arenae]